MYRMSPILHFSYQYFLKENFALFNHQSFVINLDKAFYLELSVLKDKNCMHDFVTKGLAVVGFLTKIALVLLVHENELTV